MAEVRRIYRINSSAPEELNRVLADLADRLDQLEGLRGVGEFFTPPTSRQLADSGPELPRFDQTQDAAESAAGEVGESLDALEESFNDHSERHENGGADELSVAGLSGELPDPQPPKAHGAAAHSGDIGAITQITGRAYGNMYAYNLGPGGTVITVADPDTWYEVGAGITGGTVSGFTFQNDKELKCVTPGTYLLSWAVSVEVAAANQEVEGTIMINGTANTAFASHCELMTASRAQTLCGNGILALEVDDLVSLAVLNHTTGNNIVIDHVNLSLHRVA